MKLTKDKLFKALLLTLTDSGYQQLFPVREQNEWANLGYVATTNKESKIYRLLNALSISLESQLGEYEYLEPKKPKPPSKRQLKKMAEKAKLKEKEDIERFNKLEESWKSLESIKQDEEMIQKTAEFIYHKNQEQKKTRP